MYQRARIFCLGLSLLTMSLSACSTNPHEESAGQYFDSSIITARVKSSLLNAKDIDSTHISVETYKGIVNLDGYVYTESQYQLAGQIASQVEGVQSVNNNLMIDHDAD